MIPGVVAAARRRASPSPAPSGDGVLIDLENNIYSVAGVEVARTDLVGSGTFYPYNDAQRTMEGYEHDGDGFKMIGAAATAINDPDGFIMLVNMRKGPSASQYYIDFTDNAETFSDGFSIAVGTNVTDFVMKFLEFNAGFYILDPPTGGLAQADHYLVFRYRPADTGIEAGFSGDGIVLNTFTPINAVGTAGVDRAFVFGETGDITRRIRILPADFYTDAEMVIPT